MRPRNKKSLSKTLSLLALACDVFARQFCGDDPGSAGATGRPCQVCGSDCSTLEGVRHVNLCLEVWDSFDRVRHLEHHC